MKAVLLAVGGTAAAAVGSCGFVVEANRVMLATNLLVIAIGAVEAWRGTP